MTRDCFGFVLLCTVAIGCTNNGDGRSESSGKTARTAHVHHADDNAARMGSDSAQGKSELGDLGHLHHPVTASNPAAQQAFDEGLTLVYVFNHDEAIRSFNRAARLDPKLAMAHWGVALALGPNYNIDVDAPREKQAYEAIQKAKALAQSASQAERDFIDALAARFTDAENPDLPKLAKAYADAMAALSKKYPEDLDAVTLYADALMCLNPWKLWSKDGQPWQRTPEIVATLESVLARDPDHIGANHLYIHAIEASKHPERGLEAAARLPVLAPAAGHIVHMPSHIYARVGDHESAATSNDAAVDADRTYIKNARPEMGAYTMMYYPHNMHFLVYAHEMMGNYAESKRWADQIATYSTPHLAHMPAVEQFTAQPILVVARFEKWDEAMKLPEPPKDLITSRALRHYARGGALVASDKLDDARKELDAVRSARASLPKDFYFGMLNKSDDVLAVAEDMLTAKITEASGDKKGAEEALRRAAKVEDALNYEEPPSWYDHPREALGALLLRSGRAPDAEKVFREELANNPRSGRALFGLAESLKAQKRDYDATWVESQFKTAWRNADTSLRLNPS